MLYVMMYEVKIGNLVKFRQNSMDIMLFSPDFPHFGFVVFYQTGIFQNRGLV